MEVVVEKRGGEALSLLLHPTVGVSVPLACQAQVAALPVTPQPPQDPYPPLQPPLAREPASVS